MAARRIASWLLLFALLLRGMIPAGYMPNLDPANGRGLMVICTGAGEATVAVDHGGIARQDGQVTDHGAPADTAHKGLCPFMALSLIGPVLLLLALLAPRPRPGRRIHIATIAVRARQLACAPPGARAPPAFQPA